MPQPLTFAVSGLGAFEAQHRTIGVQLQIERAYQACLGGPEAQASESLRTVAAVSSQLQTLLTRMPDGWSLETADLNDCYAVFAALRSAEDAFRDAMDRQRQGGGAPAQ
ncbi:hypothetical protein [Lamprocystis purpurea]|jgi:hypothetical protein|uniref:hypothetical protein n=1 Tax=Lamprocystis purpurea TaxID=61598 RepID=UPI00037EF719|nr:hypothetical protein [Lamprocystis purpurea]